ncbi:hypothetical protein GCM10025868_29680 [Angustibacter aerolatus]|uniref:SnoaL-like domain-containing protein n=1 Tax=Angustibacter aerolatus TaxID=1162965 RepID=A0ABQ6JHP0_9ACTN|nr:hypothetical protein GCM10025868_29680 [Angustibacter aerolatus]
MRGTPPTDAVGAAVHRAYVEFWQADVAALARSDPGWRPLLQRVTGSQRRDTVALLTKNRRAGQVVTGRITIQPTVLLARGSVARVSDCLDLSKTVATHDGEAVPGSRGRGASGTSRRSRLVSGRWLVSDIGRNTAACA